MDFTTTLNRAKELYSAITSPDSPDYNELVSIYNLLTSTQTSCSPCIYYTVMGYFKNLLTNTQYQPKLIMGLTKYKIGTDRNQEQYTGFTINGIHYTAEMLNDALVEKWIKQGYMKLGIHFHEVDEKTIVVIGDEDVDLMPGDASKEVQEPIPNEFQPALDILENAMQEVGATKTEKPKRTRKPKA